MLIHFMVKKTQIFVTNWKQDGKLIVLKRNSDEELCIIIFQYDTFFSISSISFSINNLTHITALLM